jgi:ribonuclease BN (tRNA processing enzyme)
MPSIKILGAFGGRGVDRATTCVQIAKDAVIDAGNILLGIGQGAKNVDHIFLTHCHFDHIIDIPFLIDTYFSDRQKPLTIYGLPETLHDLKEYILNWRIWPDFSQIELLNHNGNSVQFQPIAFDEIILMDGYTIKPVQTNHTVPSCGYVIEREDTAIFFTSDTYLCDRVIQEVNENAKISAIVIECSFPSGYAKLAFDSKHLTPALLADEVRKFERKVSVYINHIKPNFESVILKEIAEIKELSAAIVLYDMMKIDY